LAKLLESKTHVLETVKVVAPIWKFTIASQCLQKLNARNQLHNNSQTLNVAPRGKVATRRPL